MLKTKKLNISSKSAIIEARCNGPCKSSAAVQTVSSGL